MYHGAEGQSVIMCCFIGACSSNIFCKVFSYSSNRDGNSSWPYDRSVDFLRSLLKLSISIRAYFLYWIEACTGGVFCRPSLQ